MNIHILLVHVKEKHILRNKKKQKIAIDISWVNVKSLITISETSARGNV